MQCVKLGPGGDARAEVSADMFDPAQAKDVRCARACGGAGRRCAGRRGGMEPRSPPLGRQVDLHGGSKRPPCVAWPAAQPSPPSSALSPPARQTKLRVVLVGPPKPPSPVPEGVEEPNSPATMGYKDASQGTAGAICCCAACPSHLPLPAGAQAAPSASASASVALRWHGVLLPEPAWPTRALPRRHSCCRCRRPQQPAGPAGCCG